MGHRVNLTLCPYARARARSAWARNGSSYAASILVPCDNPFDVELGDETDPLEPALRLLGDVADSILVIPDRGDARAIDDVGWRRRCASYGVIDNRSENLQH